MVKLKIYLKSTLINEVNLDVTREYLVGRSDKCDIILNEDKSISRQHLKIRYTGSTWKVDVLSKVGEVLVENKKLSSFDLKNNLKFNISSYNFEFSEESNVNNSNNINNMNSLDEPQEHQIIKSTDVSDDYTFVGTATNEVPFLKVYDEQSNLVKVFQLEGLSWVAGRDTLNPIFIDYLQISRRHFEIQLLNGDYQIRDLGSINGTFLNNNPVPSDSWLSLTSGDIIQISEWTIHFELRDLLFDQRINQIPQEMKAPILYTPSLPTPSSFPSPMETFSQRPHSQQMMKPKRKFFVQATIGVGLLILIIFYFSPDEKPNSKQPDKRTEHGKNEAFQKLSKEQQDFVKQTYRLADNLYKEGKFELARQEIIKLHQIIPFYLESTTIEKYCQVAIDAENEVRKKQKEEQEKVEINEKVQKQVELCKKKLTPNIEMKEIEDCVSSVIFLAAGHPAIEDLKSEANRLISIRTVNAQLAAEHKARQKKLIEMYGNAEQIEKNGASKEAILAYKKVATSTLPDPDSLRTKASRKIASIEENLLSKQMNLEKSAESARKRGEFKKAYEIYKEALEINPENEVVRGQMNDIVRDLEKHLKSTWEEAAIEEGVNEVETAKIKWKKIIDQSFPEVRYYGLAKAKLKKYGVR